ncbi:MAG: 4'-phosphopantetheinyl transferase superfamily protein [Lachnospiraceae bacterium]|nr:4'-phosphopantetheinyl transferase superfamily protein [Lachnospiraceae bacterium]
MEGPDFLYDRSEREIMIYYCRWDNDSDLASHDLLKHAVEAYLSEDQESFTVCTDEEHGKPYVQELPDVYFSITHSGGYWACAVGDCEVGLDLQEVRDRETDKIAKRFFHPSEIAWLKDKDAEEFFRIWAMKESYIKYTGKGLTEGLDYFSVVDGVPAFQQEVLFREGYCMALTSAYEAAICLEQLPSFD